jgi:putative DNA primase/helicase
VLASPGSVVLLSAEDDIADTIRPRLDAAGANVKKVTALQGLRFRESQKERCFSLESDLPLLEQAIQSSPDCRLIVIDPVSSYMGGVDSHKNSDVRGLIHPLSVLASRYSVAVVLVTHFSKGQNRTAMHAPTGSIAYIAAARAAWAVVADKNDPARRLFLSIKNNLAKDCGGLAFRIVDRDVNGQTVGAVEWDADPVTVTADDALSDEGARGPSQCEQASDWLRELLAAGPMFQADVEEAANAELYSKATLKLAKVKAGVLSKKQGFGAEGRWLWFLPGCDIMAKSMEPSPATPTLAA